jgi:hypothetical protein
MSNYTGTRIFVVEDIRDGDKVTQLEEHGKLSALTGLALTPKPPMWNTLAMSHWIKDALTEAGNFDYEADYVALTGNYLALTQLIATLVAYGGEPYSIRCLAFSRANGVDGFCHVVLEESMNEPKHCPEDELTN